MVFSVPDLSINKIFVGKENREDSVKLLKEYLKKDGNAILSKLAEISPNSIVDAQKDIIKRDFDIGTGFNNKQDTPVAEDTSVKDTSSVLRVGAGYSKYEYDNDETVKFISLPLSVSIPLGSEQELILRLPLQYSETYGKNRALGAARAYQIAGGISYKTPVAYPNNPNTTHRWFLTPSFSYGLVGSKDMASVAQLVSTSVTSDLLLIDRPNYSVSMGNLIGYQKTLPLEYRGWKVTTKRENVVTRNGILVSVPLSSLMSGKLLGMDLVAEFFVTDTRAFGDPMYEDHYNEIGFTIGPKDGEGNFVNISRQQFGLGLGFQYHLSSVAKNGFGFSMSYKF